MFSEDVGKITPEFKEWQYNPSEWQLGDQTMITQGTENVIDPCYCDLWRQGFHALVDRVVWIPALGKS